MDEQEQLNFTLLTLAQNITNQEEDNPIQLAKLLLLDIDTEHFQKLMHALPCNDLGSLKNILNRYYQNHRNQIILWENELLSNHKDYPLIIATIFALDLALSNNTAKYIENILALPEENQLSLQPFVQQVTVREEYITPKPSNQETSNHNQEHLLEISQENQKLKLEKQQWMQLYQQLRQSYDYLKTTHDKTSQQLNYLKQQRFTLINQLGGSQCGSVDETIDRVKRQFFNYQKTIQKQQKQLQQKKNSLKSKQEELNKLEDNLKVNHYEEKAVELNNALRKIEELENQIVQVKGREDQLRNALINTEQYLVSKEEDNRQLQQQIATLQVYENKYLSIRKLHNQFKSKIVKNIKEIKQ